MEKTVSDRGVVVLLEMVQQVRAPVALLGSGFKLKHLHGSLQPSVTPLSWIQHTLLTTEGTLHTHGALDIHAGNILIHIK